MMLMMNNNDVVPMASSPPIATSAPPVSHKTPPSSPQLEEKVCVRKTGRTLGDRDAAGRQPLVLSFGEEDGDPCGPSWPHFPQGARRLGKGWGSAEWHLCRSGTVCRGQALVAQSLMDLAGS